MDDPSPPDDQRRSLQRQRLGCAGAIAAINLVLMGLVASSFATGPYSSSAQMAWYRLGSTVFLCVGAFFPICALVFVARRFPAVIVALIVWMLTVLLLFVGYLFYSGGGV
jgi:hypothetical protein